MLYSRAKLAAILEKSPIDKLSIDQIAFNNIATAKCLFK